MRWIFCLFFGATLPSAAVTGMLAIRHIRRHVAFLHEGAVTEGVMLTPERVSGASDSFDTFRSRFSYVIQGKKYIGKGLVSTNWHLRKKGTRVPVYYLEDDPANGRLSPRSDLYLGLFSFVFFVGIVFLIVIWTSLALEKW
jgi:hypothetical protein